MILNILQLHHHQYNTISNKVNGTKIINLTDLATSSSKYEAFLKAAEEQANKTNKRDDQSLVNTIKNAQKTAKIVQEHSETFDGKLWRFAQPKTRPNWLMKWIRAEIRKYVDGVKKIDADKNTLNRQIRKINRLGAKHFQIQLGKRSANEAIKQDLLGWEQS